MAHIKRKKRKFNFLKFILIIVLIPVIIFWAVFKLIKKNKKNYKNVNIDIYNTSQIDSLTGVEFEVLLKSIFEKQGYNVELTKKSHDYGADLVLNKNGKVSIVQAKCYDKNVGIKAVQEIISAKKHYQADELFVATNRYFSKDAIVLASEHNVILIDRDVITNLVRQFMPKIELAEKTYCATLSEEKNKIIAKYRFWI